MVLYDIFFLHLELLLQGCYLLFKGLLQLFSLLFAGIESPLPVFPLERDLLDFI